MYSKSTTKPNNRQHLIAGIQKNDDNIEFFGIRKTKEVMFMQNGQTKTFSELPEKAAEAVCIAYNNDHEAKRILRNLTGDNGLPVRLNYARQVELYIYYCFGGLDGRPDIIDGVLQEPENFRHQIDCISLGFNRKKLTLNGKALKTREIKMIDCFAQDLTDEATAQELGIAVSTFNQHKKELFIKTGVHSKPALMIESMRNQIVQ